MFTPNMFTVTSHALKRFKQRIGFAHSAETILKCIASESKTPKLSICRRITKKHPITQKTIVDGTWVYLIAPTPINDVYPIFICKATGTSKYKIVTVLTYKSTELKEKISTKNKNRKLAKRSIKHIQTSMFQRSETARFNTLPLTDELKSLTEDLKDLADRIPTERKFKMWAMGLETLTERFINTISQHQNQLPSQNTTERKMPYVYELARYILEHEVHGTYWMKESQKKAEKARILANSSKLVQLKLPLRD